MGFFLLSRSNSLPLVVVFAMKHYVLGIVKMKTCSVGFNPLRPRGLYSPWNSPGQNTGGGSLSLLQGIFPTQGSEPRSPTLQADSLPAEPPGKPDICQISTGHRCMGLLLDPQFYSISLYVS